jgi:hypothetical protein
VDSVDEFMACEIWLVSAMMYTSYGINPLKTHRGDLLNIGSSCIISALTLVIGIVETLTMFQLYSQFKSLQTPSRSS